jgi:hypothetical protein
MLVMSIKLNAVGVDEIPLSFIKSFLPVWLATVTHVFNHIFTCSDFRHGLCDDTDSEGIAVPLKNFQIIVLYVYWLTWSKVFEAMMVR